MSGACIETKSLSELIPNWKELGAPLETEAKTDRMRFLTETSSIPLPVIPAMHNHGNYIVSLGLLCQWLGQQAEELGVEIFTGFGGDKVLYEGGKVVGIKTNDQGISKDGKHKDSYESGIKLLAKQTVKKVFLNQDFCRRLQRFFDETIIQQQRIQIKRKL
jgi:electron-transferring-flavoprotein dehydrogenase